MMGLLFCQLFKDVADTEIPSLKHYVQTLGERRRGPHTQQLLRSLYQLMSDIKGHLDDSGTEVSIFGIQILLC